MEETSPSRTKKLLADTMVRMAKKIPVRRITVKKLCEGCGLQRQSFYYHFKDKYDLVAWIFMQNYTQGLRRTEVLNTEEMMRDNLGRMEKDRSFYRSALEDCSQNSLREYLLELYVKMEEDVLREYLGVGKLELEVWYTITGYSYACLEHTRAWLRGESGLTAEELAHQMYLSMPELLKAAYRSRSLSSKNILQNL